MLKKTNRFLSVLFIFLGFILFSFEGVTEPIDRPGQSLRLTDIPPPPPSSSSFLHHKSFQSRRSVKKISWLRRARGEGHGKKVFLKSNLKHKFSPPWHRGFISKKNIHASIKKIKKKRSFVSSIKTSKIKKEKNKKIETAVIVDANANPILKKPIEIRKGEFLTGLGCILSLLWVLWMTGKKIRRMIFRRRKRKEIIEQQTKAVLSDDTTPLRKKDFDSLRGATFFKGIKKIKKEKEQPEMYFHNEIETRILKYQYARLLECEPSSDDLEESEDSGRLISVGLTKERFREVCRMYRDGVKIKEICRRCRLKPQEVGLVLRLYAKKNSSQKEYGGIGAHENSLDFEEEKIRKIHPAAGVRTG